MSGNRAATLLLWIFWVKPDNVSNLCEFGTFLGTLQWPCGFTHQGHGFHAKNFSFCFSSGWGIGCSVEKLLGNIVVLIAHTQTDTQRHTHRHTHTEPRMRMWRGKKERKFGPSGGGGPGEGGLVPPKGGAPKGGLKGGPPSFRSGSLECGSSGLQVFRSSGLLGLGFFWVEKIWPKH